MKKALPFLLLGAAGLLGSCQQKPAADSATPPASEAIAPPAPATGTAVSTEAEARAAIGRHVQSLPNAKLFVVDSATAVEVDDHWQVMVPRTDWAKRMPNKAAFEVNKSTGAVKTLMVK
ncbi:hypothetical protein [Hymenobacter cellulosilyticus]|uniref:PepSY domain-containing protein n=1 Tax=Hymenobacter cellulosilyticus TaxID=2932248 RepID=A0A8T9QHK6_9BACT|nr:hypothetical protein [Hymenobacter cellulosilyticus]UOQ74293.1 hypothetical protein MUN79_10660 [Hymenobacter cellulosilyticus]